MKVLTGRTLTLAAVPVLIALGTGSAMAKPASGGPPPPKGFEADSASFVSASTGFVLGARKCSELPCTARLETTTNGGASWTALPAPAVKLVPPFTGSPLSAVSTVRFENAEDGWLFGPGLWATTNGGHHWTQVKLGDGEVIALAASDGTVFAATEPVDGGLNAAVLHESAVGSAAWTLVPHVAPANALTVFGHAVWAGLAPKLWHSTDDGQHWAKLGFSCPSPDVTASAVAAASRADVALACSNTEYRPGSSTKKVFTSSNGGKSFKLASGRPPTSGLLGTLAMPRGVPGTIIMTATSGASFLYRSVDGGNTWRTKTYADGGLDFRDLALVSATTGYIVHFSGGPVLAYGKGLLKTTNAGATWTKISIP
jgi:photosystem II stability/assembly factor-like uncharacterized protein